MIKMFNSLYWTCVHQQRFAINQKSTVMYIQKWNCKQLKTQHSTSKKKEVNQFHHYILSHYLQFVRSYENVMEKKFPTAMHVYRIFMVGIRDFYRDMKLYFQVGKKINSPGGMKNLSRQEMELYYQMRKDMRKVAPMLLLSALPFANYVVFPLVYFFPRQLLCSHFWTLQQRMEFAVHYQRRRLYNYRPVFRALQVQLDYIDGNPLHRQWANILSLLGSGVHPETEDILACIDLFRGHPYHLLHLYSGHVRALLRMHGMHVGWRRRRRLAECASILHEMDLAINREGGPSTMSQEELRKACFMRGLNPLNMKTEDMVDWLSQWVTISKEVDQHSLSLLLHCPILLAYNHPTNWSLIY